MKGHITFAMIFVVFISFAQTKTSASSKCFTTKYAGLYSMGDSPEYWHGSILVYPESDSTILFYVDVNRGAPSYNIGMLYGRMKVLSDTGVFSEKFYPDHPQCKFAFYFFKDSLIIDAHYEEYACGFGFGVYISGEYERISDKPKDFFEDGEGKKIYFGVTKPEIYNAERF